MKDELGSRMQKLRLRYIDRLAEDVARIERLVDSPLVDASLNELVEVAHKLSGISGSLGYPAVSAAAKNLDRKWSASGTNFAHLKKLVAALRHAADAEQAASAGECHLP